LLIRTPSPHPSPIRTRVCPSLALFEWPKSETSDFGSGEGAGRACCNFLDSNNRRSITFSLRLGAGGLHHHRPALLVAIDVSRIVRGRADCDLGAVSDEPALDLIACERLAQRLIEPLDNRARRAGGRHDAVVERGLETRQPSSLRDRGLVGLEVRALGA